MSRPLALLLPIAAALAFALPASAAVREGKPNIVLILADDLGYGSLACYGSKQIRTPHLDRLAASGIRLTDFHSSGPMCTPTRAALMTGRYPQRCAWVPDEDLSPVFRDQRRQNPAQRWAWGIALAEQTVAETLRDAGYRTALFGKWHLGYDTRFHPMNQGFDEFRGFTGGAVDHHTHVATHGLKEPDWWDGREIRNETGYTTDLLTRHAVDFIARHKDRPFFLYLAHAAPHDPWQGRDPAAKKTPAETYKEMIEVLDESVDSVTAALREHGLEKNTLLVFCSDNGAAPPPGVAANGRLKGRKGSLHEGGHRVPFIAAWPGVIPAGSTSSLIAMTMDLFPTFAKLAGAELSALPRLDGIDLMPLLEGGKPGTGRTLHWLFGDTWAVREGPWKLIGKGAEASFLADLDADPAEKSNRLGEQRAIADKLTASHRQWIAETGDR
jgi:arylsulfatase A-like enzyme